MAAGVDVEEAPSERRPRDLMREVIRGHQGPRDLLVGREFALEPRGCLVY